MLTSVKNPDIKISVIIPVYNRENTIYRCINSVLKQTYPAFEIIVVDDGSTDNTVKIVESINSDKLRLIKTQHKGAQAARNIGIKSAKGTHIAFLDSDDEWLPYKLEVQVEELSKRPGNYIVHGGALIHFDERNETKPFNVPKLHGNVYRELLKAPGPLFPCILAPKECFEKIGFLDENVPSYQEWDTSIALAKHYEFIFIDKPLFVYHIHSGETISKCRVKEAYGWKYIVEKYKEEIIKNCGRKVLARHYSIIGMLFYKANDFDNAKAYFYKAFRTNPTNLRNILMALLAFAGIKLFTFTIESVTFLNKYVKAQVRAIISKLCNIKGNIKEG